MKPKVGIFGLTGCAGDQLVVLNCEDELLGLVELLDIRDFLMAASHGDTEAHLDVALVEGAVASGRDEARLREIRARSDVLVAIGTCAITGGIPAMDRGFDRPALIRDVYGEVGLEYDAQPIRALHEVVQVDAALPGCPIEKAELLHAIASLLNGDLPLLPAYPVCAECRMRENVCLLQSRAEPCLGSVTIAGCDARCPTLGIACVGCRGPLDGANFESLTEILAAAGWPKDDIHRRLETFAPAPIQA